MADKKKTQPQDLASLDTPELQGQLHAALDKRAKLSFQHRVAPLKDAMELRRVRREIARLKTHIHLKEAVK